MHKRVGQDIPDDASGQSASQLIRFLDNQHCQTGFKVGAFDATPRSIPRKLQAEGTIFH
jgi:hypothetical protein